MILDLLWLMVSAVLTPLASVLPVVITDATQWDALMTTLSIANRVVDIPTVFGVIGTTMLVFAVSSPAAISLKIYKLIRGAGS